MRLSPLHYFLMFLVGLGFLHALPMLLLAVASFVIGFSIYAIHKVGRDELLPIFKRWLKHGKDEQGK